MEWTWSVSCIIFREIRHKMCERRDTQVASGTTNFEYIL